MKKTEALEKKLVREKKARQQAEQLLEDKSRELYKLNQQLSTLNDSLESQVKERTEELRSARDTAIAANKAKSQFLANMSHEIRTPLNGLVGFVDLLLKSGLNPSQRNQAEVVKSSSDLLLSIINDILEFSKIEAGKLEIEKQEFDLIDTVEELSAGLAHEVFRKGLEFSVFVSNEVPQHLISDEGRIRQVLLNLIGNAAKFTPSGEIALNVSLNKQEDQDFLHFEVKDTGIGIPESKIEHIFSAFSQADISDTRKYGGSGLGLSICREIVQAMGGEISVTSEEAKGSCFVFEIPFEKSPKPQPAHPELNIGSVELVIANKTIEKNLMHRLSQWGLECVVHGNDLVENNKEPEALIIDSSIGREMAMALAMDPFQKVIVLCKPGEMNDFESALGNFGVHILSKPVRRSELRSVMEESENGETCQIQVMKKLAGESKHVLLVEDNPINQQVAKAMLESAGFSCDVAANGREALARFNPQKHLLILMDCQMPVMDGLQATQKIREEGNTNTPIIALTANAFRKTKESCFEVGMNDFVTKPVSLEELEKALHRALKAY